MKPLGKLLSAILWGCAAGASAERRSHAAKHPGRSCRLAEPPPPRPSGRNPPAQAACPFWSRRDGAVTEMDMDTYLVGGCCGMPRILSRSLKASPCRPDLFPQAYGHRGQARRRQRLHRSCRVGLSDQRNWPWAVPGRATAGGAGGGRHLRVCADL